MTRLLRAACLAPAAAVLLAVPVVAADPSGTWRTAGTMTVERGGHTATLLNDGTVLVAGGSGPGTPVSSVEIYEPRANRWLAGPPMTRPRTGHAAVRLDDGRVLVVGGLSSDGARPLPVADAELYDPDARSWSATRKMAVPRFQPTATVLPDSRVLVAGGYTGAGGVTGSAELFNPVTEAWSPAPAMSTPRIEHAALLLHTGRVLLSGGIPAADNPDGSLASAELYDYASNRWTAAARMTTGHAGAVAAVLGNGDAVVAGGVDYQGGSDAGLQAVDLYQPDRDAWTALAPLHAARGRAGGALLGNGDLLIAGGVGPGNSRQSQSTGEIFDPGTGRWSLVARLPDPRIAETITALKGDQALLVGGSHGQTADRFVFAAAPVVSTPTDLTGALAANRPLFLLTVLLLLAVAAQSGWRRVRPN